ncbi:MAG: pseudouridine synthase [Thermoleophilia bacterium]
MGEVADWPAPGTRIHRALAQAGVASRRKAEQLVADGRVLVNDTPAVIGQPVGPGDRIVVDGRTVRAEPLRVLLLNKPMGVVTTASDPQGRPTVLDGLPGDVRLFPVGRLDINTTGALLVTNDGDLANRLLHPRERVPKVYEALVEGRVSAATLRTLRGGVMLDDGPSLPARVEAMDREHPRATWLRIEITEGRNRIVRRMCEAVGHPVQRLHRVRFAGIGVGGLRTGQWRTLTAAELARLRRVAGAEPTGAG